MPSHRHTPWCTAWLTLACKPCLQGRQDLQTQSQTPEQQAQSRCKAGPSNGPRPYWHSRPPCAAIRYSLLSLDLAARSASQSPPYASGLRLPAKPCPTLHMRALATATCCTARKTCAQGVQKFIYANRTRKRLSCTFQQNKPYRPKANSALYNCRASPASSRSSTRLTGDQANLYAHSKAQGLSNVPLYQHNPMSQRRAIAKQHC